MKTKSDLISYLNEPAQKVESWPNWKKIALGNSSKFQKNLSNIKKNTVNNNTNKSHAI